MAIALNIEFSYGQDDQSADNFDKAKSSSDEAISLIDSLKGSSLLESVVEGMNFSFPILNQSVNNTDNNNNTSESLDSIQSSFAPNQTDVNITNIYQNNKNTTLAEKELNNHNFNSSMKNMESIMIMPYPMTISSNDYIPLYSSKPSKIYEGNILTKLPCNSTKPLLQIVGSFDDNKAYPLDLDLLHNSSKSIDMCMYQSIISDNMTNLHEYPTNLYLYNPLDTSIEIPTTTSIFIGIHKIID